MKLTIHYGGVTPAVAVGRHQCRLLEFAFKHQGWHSYAKDRDTLRAVEGLAKRGSIQLNLFGQFRFKSCSRGDSRSGEGAE